MARLLLNRAGEPLPHATLTTNHPRTGLDVPTPGTSDLEVHRATMPPQRPHVHLPANPPEQTGGAPGEDLDPPGPATLHAEQKHSAQVVAALRSMYPHLSLAAALARVVAEHRRALPPASPPDPASQVAGTP